MTSATEPESQAKAITIRDFLNRSFQNRLAQEVRYTAPVCKGIATSLGMHALVGGVLMGFNPILAVLSLAPTVIGVRAAINSGRQFDAAYEESLTNQDMWKEYVPPELLDSVDDEFLDTPVEEIIAKGRAAATALPGKLNPHQLQHQVQKLLMGIHASLKDQELRPTLATATTSALKAPGSAPTPMDMLSSGTERDGFDRLLQTAIASSVLLASLRGTGKTSLLQALFSTAMEGDIIGLDPKNSNSLGILEPYFIYAPPSEGQMYLSAVLSVRDEMRRRNRERLQTKDCRPLWLVIDEYQTTRNNWDNQTQATIKDALSEIINWGRERRVFVVLMGQSPLCTDIGFSSGERANMSVLALGCQEQPLESGGGGGWDSVERMLSSSHVIPSKPIRESLQAQLAELKPVAKQRGRIISGVSSMALVPDLRKAEFGALPHQVWRVANVNDALTGYVISSELKADKADDKPSSLAADWQVSQLIEELMRGTLPIRPIDLGKTAWAGRLSRKGLIKSRSAEAMTEVAQYLTEIYEQFYLDDDNHLCLMAPYEGEK